MIFPITISLSVIFITILIHGVGTVYGVQYLLQHHYISGKKFRMQSALYGLSVIVIFLMILHFIEITIWALVYLFITHISYLSTLEEAIYFSLTTYTTLGYGDITLGPHWRIMSGFEAMNGIMLFGWSSAMLFTVVQRILEYRYKLNK